jgi:hypothetical protein
MNCNFPEGGSRGVEAATRPQLAPLQVDVRKSFQMLSFAGQSNFEFMPNKTFMNAFMIRLGPVYAIRIIKRTRCITHA